MRPLSINDWKIIYRECVEFFEGRDSPLPILNNNVPKISFPVYDGSKRQGLIAFFGEDAPDLSLVKPGTRERCLNIRSNNNIRLCNQSDLHTHILPSIKELINRHYPSSGDFINFRGRVSYTIGVQLTDKDIDGSSFNLALAMYLIMGSLKEPINKNIALSGMLETHNNGYRISRVEHIVEKLKALMAYKIDTLFIPEDNIQELIGSLVRLKEAGRMKEEGSNIVITSGEHKLEIVPVSNLEDVIKHLFGHDWHCKEYFRKNFDLGYRYRQHILKSDLVKIRDILDEAGGSYMDMNKYIELKIEPPVSRSDILKSLLNSSGKGIAIFGEAGAGKSTLLRRLLKQLCSEDIEKAEGFVPVFFQLGYFQDSRKGLLDFIFDNMEVISTLQQDREVYQAYIKKLHEDGRVLFVLDAFDEMTRPVNISDVLRQLKRVIITSRYAEMPGIAEVYEIRPLDDKGMEGFATKHITEDKWRKILSTLKPGVKDILSNPLMLSLTLFLIKGKSVLYSGYISRTRLISDGIKLLINKRLSKKRNEIISRAAKYKRISLQVVNEFLRTIAFNSFYKEDIQETMVKETLRKIKIKPIEEVIEILTTGCGILQHDRTEEIEFETTLFYRFSHRFFYEYFVALYVVDEISEDGDKFREWIDSHRFNRRFKNVFRFIPGLLDIRAAHEDIRLFFDAMLSPSVDAEEYYADLWFVARCIAEMKNRPPKKENAIKDSLVSLLRHSDQHIVSNSMDALVELTGEVALPHVVPLLAHKEPSIRLDAVKAIGKIIDKIGVKKVIPHFDSHFHGRIKKVAHELYLDRGKIDGYHNHDWFEARRRLMDEYAFFSLFTEEEIKVAAYKLYEERGYQHGHDLDDWFHAKRNIIS